MLKPRPAIESLHAYHSPIVSRDGWALDLNENMAGCSPKVLARLRTLTAEEVSKYPRREEGERVVASHLGVKPDQVLLTNGMDEAIALLFSAYLDRGDELLFADPTFVEYPIQGAACGARVIRVASGPDFALPVDEMLSRTSPRTRMIAIANPNNPTGLAASRADVIRIVEAAPDAAVLIDEAYFEFCGETMIGDLAHYPNLFVARTFSKAYGLAGLRLGVMTGAAEQIHFLRRFCPPFNVNGAAMACLEAALQDQEFVRESVDLARSGCRQIEQLCGELGLKCWPSSANFVLVRIGASADFVSQMQSRGILVRDVARNPGCDGCVRITAGTRDQMPELLAAMRESAAKVKM
jgi:histidinol-phosphate aminotransferase